MNQWCPGGNAAYRGDRMKIHDISINSLLRRKVRMFFLVFGLLISISTVITLLTLSEAMNEDIATKLDEYGANILIVPKSDDLSLSYGGMSVSGVAFNVNELHEQDIQKIKTIKNSENLSIIAPKLLSIGEVAKNKILVLGVNFDKELRLKKWWSIIGEEPTKADEVLVGIDVKQKLNIGLNQEIIINDEKFRVSGILEATGSQDDGIIFVDLNRAQQLFNKPSSISLIEVAALCYDCPIEDIVAQTSGKLPNAKVTAIRQTVQSKMETIGHFQKFSLGISIVVLLVGAIIVFSTMTASVNERTREIGIFRAIGFGQKHVLKIILFEAIIVSLLAGLLGYFAGILSSIYISALMEITVTLVYMNWTMIGIELLLSTLVGLSGGIYPAWRASRLEPTVALRTI
jgi:putative ABC transport system permease protein